MRHNPEKHRRRSIRLKGYDYTKTGAYFMTICTHQKVCLLGNIVNGEMQLNAYGRAVVGAYCNAPLPNPNSGHHPKRLVQLYEGSNRR